MDTVNNSENIFLKDFGTFFKKIKDYKPGFQTFLCFYKSKYILLKNQIELSDPTHLRRVNKFQVFLTSLPINESCKRYRVQ